MAARSTRISNPATYWLRDWVFSMISRRWRKKTGQYFMRKSVIIRSPNEFSRISPISYKRFDLLDASWTVLDHKNRFMSVTCHYWGIAQRNFDHQGKWTVILYQEKNEMRWIFDLAVDEIQSQMRENGIFSLVIRSINLKLTRSLELILVSFDFDWGNILILTGSHSFDQK